MIVPMQIGATSVNSQYATAGTNYVVVANNGAIYQFYIDSNVDFVYKKSTDLGLTWSSPVVIFAGTTWQISVWYGRWSDRTDDNIYLAYTDTVTDDILFRALDTSTDTLGTQTTVFLGASTANGGTLSITIAKGGNIVVAGYIDAGAEGGAWKSTDGGATWGGTIANPMEGVSADQILLFPGFNADTQDIMAIFWDSSSDELSVKRYDDSANTWTETSISTGMVDTLAASFAYPNVSVSVDIANSRLVVIAWSATDAASQDLRCWTITDTTVTAKTDVVANAVDDCWLAALTIDTVNNVWYAFWCGNPDGSETIYQTLNVWYKTSSDAGTTWSIETKITPQTFPLKSLISCPRIPWKINKCWPIQFLTQEVSGEFQLFTLRSFSPESTGRIIIN